MKPRKLNYRIHNPNSAEDTTDILCKLLIEVNAGKVEHAIEETVLKCAQGSEYIAVLYRIEKMEETVSSKRRRAR